MEERNRFKKWGKGSGRVASCQKPGQMIPTHRLVSRPHTFGQNPDQAIQIGSGSVLHNMIHAFFEKNGAETDAGIWIRHVYWEANPVHINDKDEEEGKTTTRARCAFNALNGSWIKALTVSLSSCSFIFSMSVSHCVSTDSACLQYSS